MNLNMSQEWLIKMAEKEANGIISVGGLAVRIHAETGSTTLITDENSQWMTMSTRT